MSRIMVAFVLMLAAGCLLLSTSVAVRAVPPKATIDYGAGTPKAGAVKGEMLVTLEWDNCTGVDAVIGGISKTKDGKAFLVKGFSVEGTQQVPLLAKGSHGWNIATGEATGTVITSATADAFQAANRLAMKPIGDLNVIVP